MLVSKPCCSSIGTTIHYSSKDWLFLTATRTRGKKVTVAFSRSSPIGRISRECLTHTVSSNETLAGIALKYDLTIEDIRRYNSLWQNDNVWPGQKLKIPVTTASPTTAEPSNSSMTSSSSDLNLSASTKDESKKLKPPSVRKGSSSHPMICWKLSLLISLSPHPKAEEWMLK